MLTRGREAQARASPDTILSLLPRYFVRAVLLLLPVDTRLRCCEVNRAWRALLADTFFARLDLSISSGLARYSLPLFRACVVKAGGQLRALDLTGQETALNSVCLVEAFDAYKRLVLQAAAANAATLTELRLDTGHYWRVDEMHALLEAAPACRLLHLALSFNQDHPLARAMLRNERPFHALRLRRLRTMHPFETLAQVVAFSSDLRCHASLEVLDLYFAALDSTAKMGAVVDACIALRLHSLRLRGCHVPTEALPELTRVIAAGALRDLGCYNGF